MVADEGFVVTIVGAVVTTIISVVILRSLKYFEKKQDSKAEEVKQTAREAVENQKIQAQRIAEELTLKNEERNRAHIASNAQIAEELKKENEIRDENVAKNIANNTERIRQEQLEHTQRLSDELKINTAKIATDLEAKTDKTSRDILNNIKDVDLRLTTMIDSLQHGSELTNGNVTKIRTDMLELQEDVDNIYDKINHDELQNDPQKKMERDRKRKIRRKQISNDSILHMDRSPGHLDHNHNQQE